MKRDYQGIMLLVVIVFMLGWYGSAYLISSKLVDLPIIQTIPVLIKQIVGVIFALAFGAFPFWILHKLLVISELASYADYMKKEIEKWENMYIKCAEYCSELEKNLEPKSIKNNMDMKTPD